MEHQRQIKKKSISHSSLDSVQESNAYLTSKLFMAKRIAQQQKEIEYLKEQIFYHTTKHAQMYEIMKSHTDQLAIIKMNRQGENMNNSSEDITKSVILEEEKECGNGKAIHDLETIITMLKNENSELRRLYEIEKSENIEKSTMVAKLTYDKFALYTELNEIIMSLKRIDMNELNCFYLSKIGKPDNKKMVISSMGIKYNLLSAQSQLALLSSAEHKPTQSMISQSETQGICQPMYINVEPCLSIVKAYEEELNEMAVDLKSSSSTISLIKQCHDVM